MAASLVGLKQLMYSYSLIGQYIAALTFIKAGLVNWTVEYLDYGLKFGLMHSFTLTISY